MNRKLPIAGASLFLIAACVFGETILVASLIVYDKDSIVIEQDTNPSEEIYERFLDHWFEGLVKFKKLSPKEYGEIYTSLDANRACSAENAEYILFGYIQKNDGNWFANVKLYDHKAKKIGIEFYSGDDISHYNRFINSLTSNILDGLEEATGLSRNEMTREKTRPFEIKLPLSAFYWTPVDTEWHSKFLGIAGIEIGIEIYPLQPKMVLGGVLLDFSLRPEFSYSCATGQSGTYPLNCHGILLAFPLCAHFHFNMKNSLYLGCGFYYEVEMMNITPKYEDKKFLCQNIFGIEAMLGYEFGINETMNFFTEIRMDFHLNGDRFTAIKQAFGISFNLYRRLK